MRVQVAERQKPLLQVELSQNSVLQATLFQLANITLVVFAQGLQIHFLFLLVHFLLLRVLSLARSRAGMSQNSTTK